MVYQSPNLNLRNININKLIYSCLKLKYHFFGTPCINFQLTAMVYMSRGIGATAGRTSVVHLIVMIMATNVFPAMESLVCSLLKLRER